MSDRSRRVGRAQVEPPEDMTVSPEEQLQQLSNIIDDLRAENQRLKGAFLTYATVLRKHLPEVEPLSIKNAAIGREVVISSNSPRNGQIATILDVQGTMCTIEVHEGGATETIKIPAAEGLPSPLQLLSPTLVVSMDGSTRELIIPIAQWEEVAEGATIKMSAAGGVAGASDFQGAGQIGKVLQSLPGDLVEVEIQGNKLAVRRGRTTPDDGAAVVLDPTNQIVTCDLGRENKRLYFTESTNVSWDQIGGLEAQKRELIEAVRGVREDAELYKYFNKRPVRGILLWGPPGCGKTLIGKATATEMARYGNGSTPPGFIYVDSSALLEKYVGATEANVRNVFQTAREFFETHGVPPVIFFEEFDAVGQRRGSSISSDVNNSVVPALLTQMDGMKDNPALVILATNRPDTLDEALKRDGRIDRKIYIPRPDFNSAVSIMQVHLARLPVAEDKTTLANLVCKELFSHKYHLAWIERSNGEPEMLYLKHIVSGAMLEGICERATSLAIRRIRQENRPPSPVQVEEFMEAIKEVHQENLVLKHVDAVRELAEAGGYAAEVTGVTPVRNGG